MIHYTSKPFEFIKEAARKLKIGGRMLIADIPNVDKKGDFYVRKVAENFMLLIKNTS